MRLQSEKRAFLALILVFGTAAAVASPSSFLVTQSAAPSSTLTTVEAMGIEVPGTIIHEEDDLNSIIEAEATLDITMDEAPTDIETVTIVE